MSTADCQAQQPSGGKVRKAAVAGQFYEGSAAQLRSDVQSYLDGGSALPSAPRMIISPHAGFVFSGPVAGKVYATVDKAVTRVVLLGPSHHTFFEGVSIAEVDSYETPLGRIALDQQAIAALRKSPLVSYVPQADAPEHCLEVQLPFVQVALPAARIVPILLGRVDAAKVAALVKPLLDDHTLVVASSDFSHYHSSAEAKKIDEASIKTILAGELAGPIDGCGEGPIRVLMHLAKSLGLTPTLLDARNSYETAPRYGSPDRVVGYVAVAYVKGSATVASAPAAKVASAGSGDDLAPEVKQYLLKLARASLDACVRGQKAPSTADAPAAAKPASGCFVTLHMNGQLRGCIGNIEPVKGLAQAVVENARSAALEDPRFSQVTLGELATIDVEVSVLTVPALLEHSSPEDLLSKLVPGRDGVVLEDGWHRSTFLPQVWDQLPDKVQFLQHLSQKGGMAADGWKKATVKTYRAIHFGEKAIGGS